MDLDSTCSHHYTSHWEWFATYQKIDGGSVSLGDDHPCKLAGVGIVRVRMYDGVIQTLKNVKHVPELKKNLISLGMLDSFGYEFRGGVRVIKVSKGALIIMK